MHPVLTSLESELRQVATAVLSQTTDNRAINIMQNNWSMAGIDRNELAAFATNLADRIAGEGGDELHADEASLKEYPQRLQFLRAQTIPYIWNGNANHAIPAYLLTLASLERAVAPALGLDPAKVNEDAKTAKTVQTRLRGLVSRVSELEPKVGELQKLADQIQQAHSVADQLPTDMVTLREARTEIQSLRDLVAQDQIAAHALFEEVKRCEAKLQSDLSKFEQEQTMRAKEWEALMRSTSESADGIIERCEDAMRTTTSVGLAGAFHERARSLNWSMIFWVVGLIAALLAGAYLGGQQLQKLSDAVQESTPPMIIWTRLFVSLLSVGAPVWFGWLATKQIGQRFRLAEDYAYKASISRAYEGYRREAVQLDPEFQAKLLSSALARLDEQPLRFVEHETHGSPWHELLASDVFRDAIKIAPDLVGKFSEMAKEKVDTARKNRIHPKTKPEAASPVNNPDAPE